MESQKSYSSMNRRAACLALAATPFWLLGCVTTPKKEKEVIPSKEAGSPHESHKFEAKGDGRMVLSFSGQVGMAPDTERGGALNPGLVGRIYLFQGDKGVPYTTDGVLIVDLFDHTPRADGQDPKLLEKWRFDETVIGKFAKRDFMGDGYSIFLPWGTYSPDISQVLIQARFTSKDGKTALFNQTSIITIDHKPVKPQLSVKQFAGDSIGH